MKKTNLILLVIGGFGFLSCLVYYIISAIPNFYADIFGTSIAYGNKDFLVWSFLFLLISAIAIIHIVEDKKRIIFSHVNSTGIILIGLIGAIYYLAKAIESIVDGQVSYLGLTITILFSIIICLGLAMIFDQKKTSK